MKKTVFKKLVAAVLSLAVVVTGLYVVAPKADEVKAADSAASVVTYTATEVDKYWGSVPENTQAGKVFAGWFTDAECTTPLVYDKLSADHNMVFEMGGKYYAKFVDAGVLSVKIQLADDKDGTKQMRVLSSVDSLDYKEVGFEVYFDGATTPITFKTTTVFKTIDAKEGDVAYKYSNKVIDNDSEYFVSGTIKGINPGKLDKDFYIKPYWKTAEGAKVYGVGRMLCVNDGVNAGAFNITVPGVANPGTSSVNVTVGGVATTAEVVGYKDGNLYLNVAADKATLPSTSKVEYSGKAAVYEKLQSVTGVAADYSWYTNNVEANTYYIATAADLWGFHNIINGFDGQTKDNFSGKTVVMVSDINATGAEAGVAERWSETAPTDVPEWGASDNIYNFSGTFDGNGNTISGLYITNGNSAIDAIGLFPRAKKGSVIKNLRMENCLVKGNLVNGYGYWTGALAGLCEGTIDNCYVGTDVYVCSNAPTLGGLVGRVNGQPAEISNSWFAGNVNHTNSPTGAIIGQVNGANAVINNCMVTGTIYGQNAGLIVGETKSSGTTTIKNTLAAGQLTYNGGYQGRVVSAVHTGTTVVLDDVYTTATNTDAKAAGTGAGMIEGTVKGIVNATGATKTVATQTLTEDKMIGNAAYENMNLDFWSKPNEDGVWVVTERNMPQLKAFTEYADADWKDGYSGTTEIRHFGWYAAGTFVDGSYTKPANATFYLETVADMYGMADTLNDVTAGHKSAENFGGDTVYLANDIDMNPGWVASSAAPLNKWLQFGYEAQNNWGFAGTFDGQGHAIVGLYINSTSAYGGLFGKNNAGASIKNFSIDNAYVTSSTGVCGVVLGSTKNNVTVENIYVGENVTVTSTQNEMGGIVGRMQQGTVRNCWFAGQLSAGYESGGIVGAHYENNVVRTATIDNCLFTGTVNVSGGNNGGIIGKTYENTTISNCVSNGKVNTAEGKSSLGTVYGATSANTTVVLTNNYSNGKLLCNHLGASENMTNAAGATDTTVYAYGNKALNKADLSFGDVWVATVNGPELKAFSKSVVVDTTNLITPDYTWYTKDTTADTFEIATAEQLYAFSDIVNSGVTFEGKTVKLTAAEYDLNPGWNAATRETEANAWTPAGLRHDRTSFRGTFTGEYEEGKSATIKGIFMCYTEEYEVAGFFGEVIGSVTNVKFENSYFHSPQIMLGTVAGRVSVGSITNVAVADDVFLDGEVGYVGGIVGRTSIDGNRRIGLISNCVVAANIKGTVKLGGIIGQVWYGPADKNQIENCLFTGTIEGTGTEVGGFVGHCDDKINVKNSLSNGRIYASGGNNGLICGSIPTNITATNVYALGSVYNTDKVTVNTKATADADKYTLLSTDQIKVQESFVGFDFDATWTMTENGPVLTQFQ